MSDQALEAPLAVPAFAPGAMPAAPRRAKEPSPSTDNAPAPSGLDAEAGLIFRLANSTAAGAPRAVGPVNDWQRLLQLAADENAIIALRSYLQGTDAEAVPKAVRRYVAMLAMDREYRMRLLKQRLEASLATLNAAGIETLLLKGSALACTIYPSFVARPMKDIDLLVEPRRADEARALMLDLDWMPDPALPGDRSYVTHHHFPPLQDAARRGLRLEIHRALLAPGHPFRINSEDIWSSSRRVRVGASHALAMHPVHHAVHLAIHFAWSHMMRLGAWHAFRDFGALADTGALDWQDFAKVASRWGAASPCYWTLRLGRTLAHLHLPEGLLEELRPRLPEAILTRLARHFTHLVIRDTVRCPSVRLEQGLWTLAMQPTRHGHGDIRPWLVSSDLLLAFQAAEGEGRTLAPSRVAQARRSARYLMRLAGL